MISVPPLDNSVFLVYDLWEYELYRSGRKSLLLKAIMRRDWAFSHLDYYVRLNTDPRIAYQLVERRAAWSEQEMMLASMVDWSVYHQRRLEHDRLS